MKQYIDKSALVAEIERRIKAYQKNFDKADNKIAKLSTDGRIQGLKAFLSFIDTLEVKEVDLDFQRFAKEMDAIFALPSSETKNTEEEQLNWEYAIAKHFYSLVLKAQKGEIWQVVDNVTHPQADKNKIYCVFTKDRYILAKVINHPKDEELLQWRCTELPFHRYDMCEGDKYMQIV